MTVFAFASAKASPGVTTAVLALAAAWPPDRQVVVAELDLDGGDVAVWWGLPPEPGLLSYAAAGRRGLRPETLLAHTQPLPGLGGVAVAAGPVAPEQAQAAVTTLLAAGLGERLAGLAGVDVLVDCGRLRPGSPLAGLLTSAAMVLVVRPRLADVAHLRPRVAALRSQQPGVLLIGHRPYDADEVAAALQVPVVGVLSEIRAPPPSWPVRVALGAHWSGRRWCARLRRSPNASPRHRRPARSASMPPTARRWRPASTGGRRRGRERGRPQGAGPPVAR